MLIQVLDDAEFLRGVVAQIPEGPSNMGVVLLFDIGVIVFPGGPGATKLQALLLAIPEKMAINEGAVVIGVDPSPAKGASVPDSLEGFEDALLASSCECLALPPARGDFGRGQGVQVLPFRGGAAMKDQIHFNKAHLRGVPVGQLQRDRFVDQGGLLGVMGSLIAPFLLVGLEEPVNGRGTDCLELHNRLTGDLKVTPSHQGIDLGPKQGRKALSAGIIKEFPAPEQDPTDLCPILSRSLLTNELGLKQQGIDLSDDILSVLPRILTVLVQNSSFLSPRSFGIRL